MERWHPMRMVLRAAPVCLSLLVVGCGSSDPTAPHTDDVEDVGTAPGDATPDDATGPAPDGAMPDDDVRPQPDGEIPDAFLDSEDGEDVPPTVDADADGADDADDADDAPDGDVFDPDPAAEGVSQVEPMCVGCGRAATSRYALTHRLAPAGPSTATSSRFRLEASVPNNGARP
jgi:hypothetical protein